ncbi:hypothetical protein F2Q69_00044744 [Brassica cretica]|uniref:Transmembrane protein n=1 Tax=Brassica cretica TaxID=69181 RepID=A0A8S9NLZ3_BRACR|nr:hypothetical protein F2Q69_00044744 [Brassica cretica]
MYFVYFSDANGVRCFAPSPEVAHLRALVLPRLLLSLFQSILALLFFLKFWLISRKIPWFTDLFCLSLPSLFSRLVAAFISARISGGFSFRHFCFGFSVLVSHSPFPQFDLEPLPSMYFVYFSGVNGVRCFAPSPEVAHLRALVLPRLLLSLFQSILALLFFLKFWLMLEAASP